MNDNGIVTSVTRQGNRAYFSGTFSNDTIAGITISPKSNFTVINNIIVWFNQ